MEQVIERLRAVPEPQQDGLAQILLHELEEDERWSASTGAHSEKLLHLTQRILADDANGLTTPLDPDQL